jgi:hypothetical protein
VFDIRVLPGNFCIRWHKGMSSCSLKDHSTNPFMLVVSVFVINPLQPNDIYIQGVSRLMNITAGGDFLGLCDQNSSYKHVSDFGRLRSYGQFLIPAHALV